MQAKARAGPGAGGRTKGGAREKELGVCPAFPNNGDSCAGVSGTLCGGKAQGDFGQKIAFCAKCEYFKSPHYDRSKIQASAALCGKPRTGDGPGLFHTSRRARA